MKSKSKSYRPSYLSSKYKSKTSKSSLKKVILSTRKYNPYDKLSEIKYFHDPKTNKIYNINTQKCQIQQLLLHNLTKKTHLNPSKLILPKQKCTNCWFNVLFVIYFISDKGRLFTKPIRYSIVKNEYNKQPINNANLTKLSHALFMLNLAIEACSTGSTIARRINTNEIIQNIYDSIFIKPHWLVQSGEFGNALEYYTGLITFLYPTNQNPISVKIHDEHFKNYILNNKTINISTKLPHIFIIEISDEESKNIKHKKTSLTIQSMFNNTSAKYSLDSVCIRDIEQQHVGCLFSLNKNGYMFDGESKKIAKKLHWNTNSFINSDFNFSIDPSAAQFNFRKGYQILYYYRAK